MPPRPQQQRSEQASPANDGLPPALQSYSPFPFAGIGQKGSVAAIDDDKFAWLENVMWTGPGQLSFLPGQNAPIYTTSGGLTIVSRYNFYISATGIQYAILFLSDGSAVQVELYPTPGGSVTTVGPASTFTVSDLNRPPIAVCWQGMWVIIGTSTAYYIWDGTNLFQPGTLGPEVTITGAGMDYASAPTVTIVGGAGSGATATATISNGSVVKVTMTNPGSGYAFDDLGNIQFFFTGGGSTNAIAQGTATIGAAGVLSAIVTDGGTGYTSQPTVTFSGGGGSGATAVASGTADSITNITIVTPGSGYTDTPSITISAPGSGNTATAVATIGYNGISAISISAAGSGYTTTPTVTVTDPTGSGSGFVGSVNMTGGTVASVTIINPGSNYQAAVVNFVGGNPSVATATGSIMPFGGQNPVAGAALAVFQNRIWLGNVTTRFISAPSSVTDFSASAGGVIQQNTDSFLQFEIFGYQPANGFLYEFGDSCINSISPPVTTTSGSTVSTTFTVTNIDPQLGTYWPQTVQVFGQAIIFARVDGIYAIYGSRLEKISTDLDNVFAGNAGNQPVRPTAATTVIFGIKCYVALLSVVDPLTETTRSLILGWDGFRWFTATQDPTNYLSSIGYVTGNYFQTSLTCWGSDSTHLYPCFNAPSTGLTKTVISKFYGLESPQQFKQALRFYISGEEQFTFTLTINNEQGSFSLGPFTYPDSAGPAADGPYGNLLTVMGRDVQAYGHLLGWTLTTTTASGTIDYMGLAYRFSSAYY